MGTETGGRASGGSLMVCSRAACSWRRCLASGTSRRGGRRRPSGNVLRAAKRRASGRDTRPSPIISPSFAQGGVRIASEDGPVSSSPQSACLPEWAGATGKVGSLKTVFLNMIIQPAFCLFFNSKLRFRALLSNARPLAGEDANGTHRDK